ncbi:ABC transporter substrate-binding protein [Actinoplanes aureus]|uniref:ABC transporter substrate-binding protein n=1 Tax=Actinoplanes aureus TaxID=2792083 RepID=UPI001E300ED3|nr:ABC transporter substrate-binding protein [Actinoplanes aureus]
MTGAALCLVIGGCGTGSAIGSGGEPAAVGAVSTYGVTPAEKTTAYPLTVRNCGQTLRFDKAPSRVLILNGASVAEVESFIVLGLQDRIAASAQSYGAYDDPSIAAAVAAVPTGGLTTNGNFDVPREQVLAMKPDLVVSTWSGGFDAKSGFATRQELAAVGIASWVPPANCAYGKPDATDAEKAAYAGQSIESSFEMLTELGRIFDVSAKAEQVVSSLRARLNAVRARVAGKPKKNVLIAYPGMSMMNAAGVPAVMANGVANDVIASAGGVNPFAAGGQEGANQLSREQLAVTNVDILAVGLFAVGEKADEEATKIFAAFPQWPAATAKAYTYVADGAYLGPANVFAVEKIAAAVHRE